MWPGRVPRVKGFSYSRCQRYFITLTTHRRAQSFADTQRASELAAQIAPFFAARCFEVLAYCVMLDHVHLLLEGLANTADLREAMRAWKQRTGYDWKQRTGEYLWQPGFHDRVMREGDDTRLVVRYILLTRFEPDS
jgi:REP element-mobilizing transposase RayT